MGRLFSISYDWDGRLPGVRDASTITDITTQHNIAWGHFGKGLDKRAEFFWPIEINSCQTCSQKYLSLFVHFSFSCERPEIFISPMPSLPLCRHCWILLNPPQIISFPKLFLGFWSKEQTLSVNFQHLIREQRSSRYISLHSFLIGNWFWLLAVNLQIQNPQPMPLLQLAQLPTSLNFH